MRNFLFLFISLVLIFASSCAKGNDGGMSYIRFTSEGINAEDGCQIKIFYGQNGSKCCYAVAKDGIFTTDEKIPADAGSCIAIFPSTRSCSISGEPKLKNLSINYGQTGMKATLTNARIYAAESSMDNGKLSFKCQSGIIKFNVTTEIAYSFSYSATGFLYTAVPDAGAGTYYMPVKPGILKDATLRVKLKSGEDYPTLVKSGATTILANQIIDLGQVEEQILGENTKGSKDMTAISFNILRGDLNGPAHLWTVRKNACLAMIGQHEPDILGTVECSSVQKEDILTRFPDFGAVGRSVSGDFISYPTTSSNSIYYNSKNLLLEKWGTIWFADNQDEPTLSFYCKKYRCMTWARFKIKQLDAHLVYICLHLQDSKSGMVYPYTEDLPTYTADARAKSVDILISRLNEINPNGYPMLLGGDLNCKYSANELKKLYNHFSLVADIATTTDKGNTFNNFTSSTGTSRIDHLFSNKCTHKLFSVDRNSYAGETFISDHFPIFTEFTIQ